MSFGRYLKDVFGEKIYKVSVDAGLTCPNRDGTIGTGGCVYCDNSAFTPALSGKVQGDTVKEQLEGGIIRVREKTGAEKFLAYFQPHTNTYAPKEKLEALFREALSVRGVVGLAIGTRPDCAGDDVLDMLEGLARETHLWVEYGLQSASDDTLRLINRCHDAAAFEDAVIRTRGRNIKTCAHVIIGLPGETPDDWTRTVKLVSALGLDGIKFHHLHVVRGTALEEMYEQGKVRVLSFGEYADFLAKAIETLPPDMVVQRLFGWAPPDALVAPDWSMTRQETQVALEKFFKERDVLQGRKWNGKK